VFQPSTLSFLKQLKKNNNKPWFDENRDKYVLARADYEQFIGKILEKIILFDSNIKELQPKDCMFRINRDVRFSKNKIPYKISLSASFKKGGKKSIYGGYYFHLQPGGNSFIGGGLWSPEPDSIKKVRQEIDYNFPEFQKIIKAPSFVKRFGELEREKGQVLINVPKGYEKDNPAGEYLKLKSWVASQNISDEILTQPALIKEVLQGFKALQPLLQFINRSFE
jgi:uncharacterized protein (TIGR02453 family)